MGVCGGGTPGADTNVEHTHGTSGGHAWGPTMCTPIRRSSVRTSVLVRWAYTSGTAASTTGVRQPCASSYRWSSGSHSVLDPSDDVSMTDMPVVRRPCWGQVRPCAYVPGCVRRARSSGPWTTASPSSVSLLVRLRLRYRLPADRAEPRTLMPRRPKPCQQLMECPCVPRPNGR
jgi:hypothetical protein